MNDRKTRGHKDVGRTTRRWRCILTLLFRIQNVRPRAEPKDINYKKNIINIRTPKEVENTLTVLFSGYILR